MGSIGPGAKVPVKLPSSRFVQVLVDEVRLRRVEAELVERDRVDVAARAPEHGPVLERPDDIELVQVRRRRHAGVERLRVAAADLTVHLPQVLRARRVDVVELARYGDQHRRRALRRLHVRRQVPLGLVGQQEQRPGQRRDHGRAPGLAVAQLDVVRVVAPDDVVERVVLGQAGEREAVGAEPAPVHDPDELGPHAPARQHEVVAADLLADRLHVAPVGLHEIHVLALEVGRVRVVTLVAEVPERVHLEVVPARPTQLAVERPDDGVERGGVGGVDGVVDPVAADRVAGLVAHEPVLVGVHLGGVRERGGRPQARLQPLAPDVLGERGQAAGELRVRVQPRVGQALAALVPVVDLQVLEAVRFQHVGQDVGGVLDVGFRDLVEEREPRHPAHDGLRPDIVGPGLEEAEAAVPLVEPRPEAQQDFGAARVERERAACIAVLERHDAGPRPRLVVHRQHPVTLAVVDGLVAEAPAQPRRVPDDGQAAQRAVGLGRERLRAGGHGAGELHRLAAPGGERQHLGDRVALAERVERPAAQGRRVRDPSVEDRAAVVGDRDKAAGDHDAGGLVRRRRGGRGGLDGRQREQEERGESGPQHARRISDDPPSGRRGPGARRGRSPRPAAPGRRRTSRGAPCSSSIATATSGRTS